MRFSIVGFLSEAECEISGKTGECVVVESDENIDAIISLPELTKMVRFRAKQEEKRQRDQRSTKT